MSETKSIATPMQPMAMPASKGSLTIFQDAKSFEIAERMSRCLAASTIIPKEYQNNVPNCMIALEMASRINTSPMMVMQNLYIVNGRPSWSSQWIIATINTSHRFKTPLKFDFGYDDEDGGLSCKAWAEDYDGNRVYGTKITMTMAEKEGWLNKNGSKWKTMPEVMIQYRAASFFGRMHCSDLILGLYSVDEAMDMETLPEQDGPKYTVLDNGQVVEIPDEPDMNAPITQEQRQTLFKLAKDALGENYTVILKEILEDLGYKTTQGMPISVYNAAIDKINEISEKAEFDQTPPEEE